MTKNDIALLVQASYKNDVLDEKKVFVIAKNVSRRELKKYIRALKLSEQSRNVSLVIPDKNLYNTGKILVKKIFGKKNIVVTEDPKLLLGMVIQDGDMVYDVSLREKLSTVLENVKQSYS
ncbi:MAG: F0F1 ATP synthase subunit delta [Candidatus Levyibacteriota bacterium]